MIKYDIYMGAHYLNRQAKQRLRVLELDKSLQESRCNHNGCGDGEVTIGFRQDPEQGVRPYVKKACCENFKDRISKVVGNRCPMARGTGNTVLGQKRQHKAKKW